ncbi:hypothetical protein AMTRI_Chr11g157910 [Amborella trichopoda]
MGASCSLLIQEKHENKANYQRKNKEERKRERGFLLFQCCYESLSSLFSLLGAILYEFSSLSLSSFLYMRLIMVNKIHPNSCFHFPQLLQTLGPRNRKGRKEEVIEREAQIK